MLRVLFRFRCTRPLLILMCFGLVNGCNSLDRKYAESSMLVAQMNLDEALETAADLTPLSFNFSAQNPPGTADILLGRCLWNTGLMPNPIPVLYIMRLPEDGSAPLSSAEYQDGIFIFPDITAGRYRIFELWLPVNGASGLTMNSIAGGV